MSSRGDYSTQYRETSPVPAGYHGLVKCMVKMGALGTLSGPGLRPALLMCGGRGMRSSPLSGET